MIKRLPLAMLLFKELLGLEYTLHARYQPAVVQCQLHRLSTTAAQPNSATSECHVVSFRFFLLAGLLRMMLRTLRSPLRTQRPGRINSLHHPW